MTTEEIELLAREIFAWQFSTSPIDFRWENAHKTLTDEYLKAAALPTEERTSIMKYRTSKEMNLCQIGDMVYTTENSNNGIIRMSYPSK